MGEPLDRKERRNQGNKVEELHKREQLLTVHAEHDSNGAQKKVAVSPKGGAECTQAQTLLLWLNTGAGTLLMHLA